MFSNRESGTLIAGLAVVNAFGVIAVLWLLCNLPNYFGSVGPLVAFTGAGLAVLADVAIAGLAVSMVQRSRAADVASRRPSQPRMDCSEDQPSAPATTARAPAPPERSRGWTASSTAGSTV